VESDFWEVIWLLKKRCNALSWCVSFSRGCSAIQAYQPRWPVTLLDQLLSAILVFNSAGPNKGYYPADESPAQENVYQDDTQYISLASSNGDYRREQV
jgi:hypothetical protein